ncbi:MAG: TerB family tellurite resistance protein [Clostridiales bacterium]|nr:TerB family tellurite resistance protein [Clostridiales bacterium]
MFYSRYPSSLLNILRDYQLDNSPVFQRAVRNTVDHSMDDLVSKPSLPTIKDPSYIQLVRIALCYYIAKADQVKPDEQEKIDQMCEELLNDPEMNPDYRYELRMILADKGTSFNNVRRYLNRIEAKELENFWKDVMAMAEMSGEITDNERKALLVYESYVKERMDMEKMPDVRPVTGKPRVVSLTCKRCSAVLEVNANLTTAFCPYCGTKHIIYQENK